VNSKTLNKGKSWLSQRNYLDMCLIPFTFPKKPKSSPNIQTKGLPQGLLLLKEILMQGRNVAFYY